MTTIAQKTPKIDASGITGRKVKNTWFDYLNWVIMTLVVLATLYPFWYLVVQSFSSTDAINSGAVSLWPVGFNVDTYKIVMAKPNFFRYYGNTILYVVVGTVIAAGSTRCRSIDSDSRSHAVSGVRAANCAPTASR